MNKLEISSIPFLHRCPPDEHDFRWLKGALPIAGIVLPRLSFVLASFFKLQNIVTDWHELHAKDQAGWLSATRLALTHIGNAALLITTCSLVWMGRALGIQLSLAINLFESVRITKNALLAGNWHAGICSILSLTASTVQLTAALTTNGLYLMVSAQLALCLADMYQSLMELSSEHWFEGISLLIAAALRFNIALPATGKVVRRITHTAADQAAIDKIIGQHKATNSGSSLELNRALKLGGYSDQLCNISMLNEEAPLQINDLELERCDLRGTNIDSIYGSCFSDCLCCNMSISQADVIDSSFKECSLVGLDCYNTTLRNCKFYACNLSESDLTNAALFDTALSYSNLNGASLHGARIKHTEVKSCDLKGVYGAHCQLIDSKLTACSVEDSNWFTSSWNHCEIDFCIGSSFECVNASFQNTKICNSTLPDALFSGGVFIKSGFERTNLTHALLSPALVKDCYLQDCSLKNLVGAVDKMEFINCQPTHDNSLRVGVLWRPDIAGASNSKLRNILQSKGIQVVRISNEPPLNVNCQELQKEWQPILEKIKTKAVTIKDAISSWKEGSLAALKEQTKGLMAQLHGIVIPDGAPVGIDFSVVDASPTSAYCAHEYQDLMELVAIHEGCASNKPVLAVGAGGITAAIRYQGGVAGHTRAITAPEIKDIKLNSKQNTQQAFCHDFYVDGIGKGVSIEATTKDGKPAVLSYGSVTALAFNPEALIQSHQAEPLLGCDPASSTNKCSHIAKELINRPQTTKFCDDIWKNYAQRCRQAKIIPLTVEPIELSQEQISDIVNTLPETVAKAFRGCSLEELNARWHASIGDRSFTDPQTATQLLETDSG